MMDRVTKRWFKEAEFTVNQDMKGVAPSVELGLFCVDDQNFRHLECACESCSQ